MFSAKCSRVCAFALSLSFSVSFVPSLAGTACAEEALAPAAQRRVEGELLKPLASFESERSKFSRARMPPRERRVRVTQTTTTLDKDGRAYVPFAVDVRFGEKEWQENDIVGCVYLNAGIFVKRGEQYRPAAFLLGKNVDPAPGVCVAGKQA